MAHHWFAIAKAEFLVWSSKARSRRVLVFSVIAVFGFFWSFYLIPEVWRLIIGQNPLIYSLLMVSLPGLMRTVMLILWMLIFIYPILYALQEIRIGQWEIILSCNVSTKSLLTGTFVGKIPSYGLMVLFLAPILLSPFILAYSVTILGQLIMLGSVLLVVLSTLWMSNLIALAVQAKIGESQRGADLAKALSMIIGLVAGLPLYALMLFAGPMSEILGMNILLVFPFTWGADMTSWGAILFSPNVTPEMIDLFVPILGFDILTDTLLLLLFTLVTVIFAFRAADTVFTFQLGARTEVVTTVVKENIAFRGIRRVSPGPFGILVVTSLKDFFRKAENLSRLAYGVMMAVLMPPIMNISTSDYPDTDPLFQVFMPMFMMSYMLMIIAAMTFGGTGFIESKDHIWVIRNAPLGSKKFIIGRLVSYYLSGLPMALVPSIIVVLILGIDPLYILALFLYSYSLICCTVMVSVGVMSVNPSYENTRSRTFAVNAFIIAIIVFGTTFASLFAGIFYLGDVFLASALGLIGGIIVLTVLPLAFVGLLMVWIGIKALARPER